MIKKLLGSVREYKKDSLLAPATMIGEVAMEVTIPMLMPHIITNTIYTLVDRFTTSQVVQLANETYQRYNYGLSSVFSLTSTMITILILGLIVYLLNKRAFYYN